MSTVLITGINGFIGSQIAEKMLAEGFKVRGLVRKTSDLKFIENFDIELFYGDITQPETLDEPTNGADIVIHAAAFASDWGPWEKFRKINVEGTMNIARAAHKNGVKRFVLISTVAMYGFGKLDVKESDPKADTIFHYNESKKLAEKEVFAFAKEVGMPITAIKPGNVYGVRDHTFMEKYLDAMLDGKAAYINNGQSKTCPTYHEHLVQAIHLACVKDEALGESFFITDGRDINWKQFTDAFADELGIKRPKTSVPFWLGYTVAYLMEMVYKLFGIKNAPLLTRYRISNGGKNYTFSIDKAKEKLGYNPDVPFETAVKRTVEWYKNRNKQN
jgi:nucleoside-diphosphate-sugar epimerase